MKQMLSVALREIVVALRRPSFYIATFVIPAITGLLFFGSTWLNASFAPNENNNPPAQPFTAAGIVDQAGVIATYPHELGQALVAYPDEAAAAAALRMGRIGSYFVIAPDYRAAGRVVRVSRQVSLTSASGGDTRSVDLLLRANLANDPQVALRLTAPVDLQTEVIGAATEENRAADPNMSGTLSVGLAFLLAFAILNGGGGLVQSVAEEKENRTIEIVLTSVRPWQFMAGKLIGLGAISLVQLALWLVFGRSALSVGKLFAQFGTQPHPLGGWPWMIVLFLLGYLFYGGIMAAIGALGATARESGQVSGFMTLPLLMPLWFGSALTDAPNGTVALVLSLIPFTAPVTMMVRLSQGPVPVLHILASVGLLALAVLAAIWFAARLFRANTLLTGTRPTPRALWQALRG